MQSISRSRIPKRLRSLRRCAATHVASEVEKVVWNSGAVLDMCKDMPCCLPRLSTCWRHASTMDLTLRSGMLRRTVTILTIPCLLNVVDFVLTILVGVYTECFSGKALWHGTGFQLSELVEKTATPTTGPEAMHLDDCSKCCFNLMQVKQLLL